jgi:hypothetical protein
LIDFGTCEGFKKRCAEDSIRGHIGINPLRDILLKVSFDEVFGFELKYCAGILIARTATRQADNMDQQRNLRPQ